MQPAGDAAPVKRGWWRRNRKRLAVVVVLLAVVGSGSVYYYVCGRILVSEPFKRAWDIVTHDKNVIAALGEPIGGGWTPHGNVTNDPAMPEARIIFGVSGPKGSAKVTANGRRIDGIWGFPDFKVDLDGGKQIDVAADQPSDVPLFNGQQPNPSGPKIEKATPDQDIKIELPTDAPSGK